MKHTTILDLGLDIARQYEIIQDHCSQLISELYDWLLLLEQLENCLEVDPEVRRLTSVLITDTLEHNHDLHLSIPERHVVQQLMLEMGQYGTETD